MRKFMVMYQGGFATTLLFSSPEEAQADIKERSASYCKPEACYTVVELVPMKSKTITTWERADA